jgi:hypothetical protein
MAAVLATWILLSCVLVVRACSTDDDCSLNGVCSTDATCHCDAGWTGTGCGVLDLLPATRGSGYNRTAEGTSSWGGKIVRDTSNSSVWHLFAAEFTGGCGLNYWAPMSRIVRAESITGPAGPYTFAAEVAPTFAHNPTVAVSPDGQFLLYHSELKEQTRVLEARIMFFSYHAVGCPFPQPSHCEAPRFSCGAGDDQNGESGISLLTSRDLLTWDSVGMIFNGSAVRGAWDADATNPSALVLSNGTVILAYRGCPENCANSGVSELISIAAAPGPYGPYSRITPGSQPIFSNPNEDPHVWQDARGNWHLLMHSLEKGGGWGGGPRVGRHAFAHDVRGPWTFGAATLAFNTTVHFTDGTTIIYSRRERPQLLWSEGRPIMLTTGVQEAGSPQSYTLCQPISA